MNVSVPNSDESIDELNQSLSWSLIDVVVDHNDVELVSDFLWSNGVVAIEEKSALNSKTCLRTSVGDQPEIFIFILGSAFPHAEIEIVHIDKSVSETWREFAQPTWIEDDFVIVPQWIEPPLAKRILKIEPLDTFGLGNHPTTILALKLIINHVPRGSTVFDLGSGSGILAIAATKFLDCSSSCYDIAQGANKALSLNASLNNVGNISWINGYPLSQVDVVVANILAPVLIEQAPKILDSVANSGIIVLSGMRSDQIEQVLNNFTETAVLEINENDGWVAVALQKLKN